MKLSFTIDSDNIKYILPSIMFFLCANHASAMEFTFGYYLPASTEYNSNIQMVESNKDSVQLYKFTPRFTTIARDELNTIKFDGSLLIQRSSDKTLSEDREDPSLNLGWQRAFERGSLNLSTGYLKSSTRTSELTESGQVFKDGSAIDRSYNLGLDYLISDKLTIASGVGYQSKQYSATTLSDYSTKNFNAKLSYLYSEKLTPFVSYSINRFNDNGSTNNTLSGNTNGNSTSQNYNVGYTYLVSPQLNYNVAVGVNHVNTIGSGWIGSAGLTWLIYDKSKLDANISRANNPSGLGGFQKSDNLNTNYTYEISPFDSVGAGFSWGKNKSINDLDSKQLTAYYSRVLTEYWNFRAYTQYRNLKSDTQQANGYMLGVSISFNQPNF